MIRKLLVQLFIIIFGVSALALILSVFYAGDKVKAAVLSQWTDNVRRNSDMIGEYMNRLRDVTVAVASNDLYSSFLAEPTEENRRKIEDFFLKICRGTGIVQAARIVNLEGDSLIYVKKEGKLSDFPGYVPVNISSKEFFKKLSRAEGESPFFSNFERGLTPGDTKFGPPMIRSLYPLYFGGKKAGYLLINFEVTPFYDFLFPKNDREPYSFIAVYRGSPGGREGIFLLHPERKYEFADQFNNDYYVSSVFTSDADRTLELSESGVFAASNGDYLVFNTVTPYGENGERWKIVTVLSGDYVCGFYDVARHTPFLPLAGAMLFSVALALVISKRLLGPINVIHGAILKICGGDLNHRLKDKFPRDLRPIANSVNCLADSLAARMGEVEAGNKKIEKLSKLSAMSVISGGIAHELNSPLNSILIACDFIETDLPPERREDLELVRSQAGKCAGIITSLRALAPGSAAALKKSRENLRAIAEKACVGIFLEDGVTLERNLSDVYVLGDPNLLTAAVTNLIKNSSEAIKGGGKIEVKTFISGGKASVSVEDNGGGLDGDLLLRMPPEPFITSKKGEVNMGLGLFLVYKIVADHGGEVKVFSQTGVGVRFVLEFPDYA